MVKHLVPLYEALIDARSGDYMTADMVYSDALSKHYRDHLGELYDAFYANVQLDVSLAPGWIPIYINAVKKIQEVIDANPGLQVRMIQVKQKFGGLRIASRVWSQGSHAGEDEDLTLATEHEQARKMISQIIHAAEIEAAKTCETCGEPGVMVSPSGWIRIACEKHTK